MIPWIIHHPCSFFLFIHWDLSVKNPYFSTKNCLTKWGGISIDIFVLDNIPSNKLSAWLQFKRLCIYRRILINKVHPYHKNLWGRALNKMLRFLENSVLIFRRFLIIMKVLHEKCLRSRQSMYCGWNIFVRRNINSRNPLLSKPLICRLNLQP